MNKVAEADTKHIQKQWPHHEFITALQAYNANIGIRIPEEGDHGISWLELCILYEHRTRIYSPEDLGKPPSALKRLLPKTAQYKRIVQNFSVARRRIRETTPGGDPTPKSGRPGQRQAIGWEALARSPASPPRASGSRSPRRKRTSFNTPCSNSMISRTTTRSRS